MNLEQIVSDYERDGVVRVRGLLSAEQVVQVRRELERYMKEVLPGVPAGDRTFEADGVSVRNMWRMEEHDAFFREFAEQPRFREIVERMVHGEPVLIAVETFNKPARTGSGVPWHQDNAYFCQEPPDVLTIWIAIDAATVANGAIYYVPGSQHQMVKHVASGVQGNSFGVKDEPQVDVEEQFCGTLEAGDALIHHSQTLHRSEPNLTDQSRCGLLLVFRGSHTQDNPALKTAYLEAVATVNV